MKPWQPAALVGLGLLVICCVPGAVVSQAAEPSAVAGGKLVLKEKTRLKEPSPRRGAFYTGATGVEMMTYQARSTDNGQTWSPCQPTPDFTAGLPANFRRNPYPGFVDPVNGRMLSVFFAMDRDDVDRKIDEPAETESDSYIRYRVSLDGGKTFLFDEPVIQKGDYNFKHPLEGLHLGRNAIFLGDMGCRPIRTRQGNVIVPAQMTILNDQGKLENYDNGWDFYHSLMLIGTWRDDNRLDWQVSEQIKADPKRTVRGLYEPTLSEMPDGRILCVMRGSNGLKNDPNHQLPSRKWYSVSSDGGFHWTAPEPWRYANGKDFSSPSSMSQLIPHSNGRYYWIGNIAPADCQGNAPRYPLVIGEVDPKSMMLIEESVVTIDTRDPDEPAGMQLSNFYACEDRATGDIVLPMQRWMPGDINQWVIYRIGTEGNRVSQATAIPVPELQKELGKVYTTEGPLATVRRELNVPYPQPNASSVISCDYWGASGQRRYERLMYQIHDDVYQDPEIRFSDDNAKTWSPWQIDTENDIVQGERMWWQWCSNGIVPGCRDPESGLLVSARMLRGFEGGDPRKIGLRTLHSFTFYAISNDDGKTWSPWKQLKFEDGPDYSPETRETPEFLAKNQCWFYFNILNPQKSGGLVLPVISNIPVVDEGGKPSTFEGVRCFLGKWDAQKRDYGWIASEPVTASKKVTAYLEEPWLAELNNGNLLLDMRGTNRGLNPADAPGRHWYSVSKDGGRTWSKPADWRYDDGTQFFSPATYAKMLRHSQTGKLYWFGNISRGPTTGNSPRYPFYIAEIDEGGPAIKRETLTIVDDYDPNRHTPQVQFSNFFVFENRETHEFELYLSPYGQYANVYQASVYKYAIRLKK